MVTPHLWNVLPLIFNWQVATSLLLVRNPAEAFSFKLTQGLIKGFVFLICVALCIWSEKYFMKFILECYVYGFSVFLCFLILIVYGYNFMAFMGELSAKQHLGLWDL